MRPTRTSQALAFAALSAAALSPALAAAPASAAIAQPLLEQTVVPATEGYFSWQRFPAQPAWTSNAGAGASAVLWPDATIRGFDTLTRPSSPAGPGRNLTLDLVGGAPTDPEHDDAVPRGSLYGQVAEIANEGVWDGSLAAVQGSNWLFTHSESRSGNPSVQRRDEAWALLRRSSAKARVGSAPALLATRDGVRAAWTQNSGKTSRVVVRSGSFGKLGTSRKLSGATALPLVTSAGRLVVLSQGRAELVSKRGRFSAVDKRSGKRLANASWSGAQAVSTRRDTIVAFRTGESIASTGQPTFARVGATGKVSEPRSLGELGVPLPARCSGTGAFAPGVTRMVAGPAGTPVVGIVCREASGAFTSVIFELDASLRLAQLVAVRDQHVLTPVATGADGHLVVSVGPRDEDDDQTTGWGFSSYALPDAVAATPGKVSNLRAAGQGLAKVRLTCTRQAGLLCTGIVTLRSGGKVVGWAPYALTGRGSWAASTFDRTIKLQGASATSTKLPAGTTATLSGLPATIDRSAEVPPLI